MKSLSYVNAKGFSRDDLKRDYRKYYLPAQIPSRATLGLAFTGVFIAIVALLLEFYGWQQPFLRMASPVFGLQSLSQNDLLFYAQVYTTASFLALLVLLRYHGNSWDSIGYNALQFYCQLLQRRNCYSG